MDCEQYAKLACNFLMQWNLGRLIATAEKKTATHTFWTCGQFSEFHIFRASKCTPAHVTPGTHTRFCPPPPPAATDNNVNHVSILVFVVHLFSFKHKHYHHWSCRHERGWLCLGRWSCNLRLLMSQFCWTTWTYSAVMASSSLSTWMVRKLHNFCCCFFGLDSLLNVLTVLHLCCVSWHLSLLLLLLFLL